MGRVEKEVAGDADVEGVAGVDLDRGLDVEVAAGDVDSKLGHVLAYGGTGGLCGTGVGQNGLMVALGELEGGAEGGGEQAETQEAAVMVIHVVAEAGGALGILADHADQVDRCGIGEDDAIPDNLNGFLAIGDPGVVSAHQPRSLWNQ